MVIFDCDGVLTTSEKLAAQYHVDRLPELNLTIEQAAFLFAGRHLPESAKELKVSHNYDLPHGYGTDFFEVLSNSAETELKAVSGVAELFEKLHLPFCIASNGSRQWLRRTLRIAGLLELPEDRPQNDTERVFYVGMDGENIPRSKPAPDLLLRAMKGMQSLYVELEDLQPMEVLMIGDSVADMGAARAAGMQRWGFTGGGHSHAAEYICKLREAGAKHIVGHMDEVLPKLRQINSGLCPARERLGQPHVKSGQVA
jgi:beta-phosphoglucomutase-like phosphatase (HAD superfamily)